MKCPNCGTENRPGRRFCSECGTALSVACPSCGAANEPEDRFCGQCGSSLGEQAPASPESTGPSAGPESERRLVSVLFADLVGFTSLSEHRDPEETRELLTRYFEDCRRLIARYGGTVEKFIGDAVMAVWGTPVVQEDDAERAVRAGLELTDAVAAMGSDVGARDLQARVGVLTGEAAVTIGAQGQGMVAGDLVNTASRIQSVAPPGGVLVGDVTRRASEAAVAYEDFGTHELKGREEPLRLWRATRVVGGRKGALRFAGLETPFVGRQREMRLAKEMFHVSAEEGIAHLVSVMGVAGVGKSRLSWEFEKYIDGLAEEVWWHRGRCLAYGEGIAYWALAEMVRSRARIVEGEEVGPALDKLRASIAEMIPDDEERSWAEPRLAHLLGLEDRTARDQSDLFSAWRLFFERMADQGPVTMIFEDLQWADAALLDFIEYLMEWSKDHPIFVMALSRPELMDRRPTWGAGRRNFTSLSLEPLSAGDMEALLRGLVPGLPDELRDRIRERAEGIPLYAVETVRMLLDRGLLLKEDGGYRLAGRVEDLEVPESLHGLIAARLDGLAADERLLLQDAAVLGKTFTKPALVAVTGIAPDRLEELLTSLVRKELLSVQLDPRSPERGQYGFLQDLVRRVAYETLSRKERKARHLAVADYLSESWGGDEEEVVEVVASHLLEAHRAAPTDPDAAGIKERAREALVRAGEHAVSLAANEQAQRYFEEAGELADDALTRANLAERAGHAARAGGRSEVAASLYERAIALYESEAQSHAAARVTARLGEIGWDRGRFAEALDRMEESLQVLSGDEPDEDLAMLAAQLGRFRFFSGDFDRAEERIDQALEIAEAMRLPEVLSQALNSRSLILGVRGRREEAVGILQRALDIALEHDVPTAAMRAYYNLADANWRRDQHQQSEDYVSRGLALARKLGDRYWEWQFLGASYQLYGLGEWGKALARAAELPGPEKFMEARLAYLCYVCPLPMILVNRGQVEEAEEGLSMFAGWESSDDIQERSASALGRAVVFRARGKLEEVIRLWDEFDEDRTSLGTDAEFFRESLVETAEAALALDDLSRVEQLLKVAAGIPPSGTPPSLPAHLARLGARLALAQGSPEGAEPGFKAAAGLFREIGIPFWLAVTLLEHGEWLTGQGRAEDAAPLLNEARAIFDRLAARPWLERVDASMPAAVAGSER
jgi:predicted ATPase/class 3 adenylate cyclase